MIVGFDGHMIHSEDKDDSFIIKGVKEEVNQV